MLIARKPSSCLTVIEIIFLYCCKDSFFISLILRLLVPQTGVFDCHRIINDMGCQSDRAPVKRDLLISRGCRIPWELLIIRCPVGTVFLNRFYCFKYPWLSCLPVKPVTGNCIFHCPDSSPLLIGPVGWCIVKIPEVFCKHLKCPFITCSLHNIA